MAAADQQNARLAIDLQAALSQVQLMIAQYPVIGVSGFAGNAWTADVVSSAFGNRASNKRPSPRPHSSRVTVDSQLPQAEASEKRAEEATLQATKSAKEKAACQEQLVAATAKAAAARRQVTHLQQLYISQLINVQSKFAWCR